MNPLSFLSKLSPTTRLILVGAGCFLAGAACSGLVRRGCLALRPGLANAIGCGMAVRDAAATAAARLREDASDIMEEARQIRQARG